MRTVGEWLSVGSVLAVLCGLLYEWGYWSPFGVDFTEYVSLADVLKLSALRIITLMVPTFLILLYLYTISSVRETSVLAKVLVGLPNERPAAMKPSLAVLLMIFSGFLLYSIAVSDWSYNYKWRIVGAGGAILLYYVLERIGATTIVESPRMRPLVFMFPTMFLALSYVNGADSGRKLRDDRALPCHHITVKGSAACYRVVGALNGIYFFFDPVQKMTVIVRAEDVLPLAIPVPENPLSLW